MSSGSSRGIGDMGGLVWVRGIRGLSDGVGVSGVHWGAGREYMGSGVSRGIGASGGVGALGV